MAGQRGPVDDHPVESRVVRSERRKGIVDLSVRGSRQPLESRIKKRRLRLAEQNERPPRDREVGSWHFRISVDDLPARASSSRTLHPPSLSSRAGERHILDEKGWQSVCLMV